MNVHDVTIQNIYLRGLYAASGGTFTFKDNTVTNVQGDPDDLNAESVAIMNWGGSGLIQGNMVSNSADGICSNYSTGTQYLDNTVTTSRWSRRLCRRAL